MNSPTRLIVIGEIGTDVDEAIALIMACFGVREGYIDLQAVIANHVQSLYRARNAKQVLSALGLGDVPVGMGERGFGTTSQECEKDPRYLADPTKIGAGRALLQWTLQQSPDHSVTLVLNSGFTDAVWLWMDDPGLFLKKVNKVVIMGGVEMDGEDIRLSREGFIIPHIGPGGAANNNFDPGATWHVYDAMQRHGVPTITTTRYAAYASKMPFGTFKVMAASGNQMGARIAEVQGERFLELWMKANAPAGSFERGDLPERCNRQWFIKTFCGGSDPGGGNVLDHIAEVAWYDPINLIASVEGLCSQFFVPTTVEVKGASHQVIGLSETNTGVRSPKELRQFMRHGVAEALRLGQTPIPVF